MHRLHVIIANFNSVVEQQGSSTPHSRGFRQCTRGELARLTQDGVAQILSYLPYSYVPTLPGRFAPSLRHHTLAAVTPRTRLYAEALVNRTSTTAAFEGVQISSDGELVYWIGLHGTSPSLARLELALWWAEGCGLPVVLCAPDACRRLLSVLSVRARRQVRRLHLFFRPHTLSDTVVKPSESANTSNSHHNSSSGGSAPAEEEGDVEEQEAGEATMGGRWLLQRGNSLRTLRLSSDATPVRLSCSTFLNALPTFPCLTTLFIDGEFAVDPRQAAAAITEALRVLRGLPVAALTLRCCEDVTSLADLAGAPCLRQLTVHGCGICTLEGLSSCPALLEVDVSGNKQLTDVSGLAGAPRLWTLLARGCALLTTNGLSSCAYLRFVDLSYNAELRSLDGVAGAPSLQQLTLTATAVGDLSALRFCKSLVTVDVRGCRGVRDITPLMHLDVYSDVPQ